MKLNAKNREITGSKVKTLRRKGEIPAVLYGKGSVNINLTLNLKEFIKVYKDAGENTVLDLYLDGSDEKNTDALIYDVNLDPISDQVIHVDLYKVDTNKEVTTDIPLIFKGESNAVKFENGVLIKNIYAIEVSALPKNLPHEIVVNLASLKTFDDVIKVSDLNIPKDVTVKAHAEDVIASVMPPRTQEELESLSGDVAVVNLESIKVESEEKKAKKEETKE
ncbi:MAG: 50S ribosomal protein L25 [Patescibacteria group bacterium]